MWKRGPKRPKNRLSGKILILQIYERNLLTNQLFYILLIIGQYCLITFFDILHVKLRDHYGSSFLVFQFLCLKPSQVRLCSQHVFGYMLVMDLFCLHDISSSSMHVLVQCMHKSCGRSVVRTVIGGHPYNTYEIFLFF